MYTRRYEARRGGGCLVRLLVAALIAGGSLVTYFSARQENPVTGETQHIDLTVDQEIALGLQAAPQMAEQFGGLDPDPRGQALVEEVGMRLMQGSPAGRSPYRFAFHLLADDRTINAFALPGGQVFITRALFDRLTGEGELAGVLGHEIGHVVGRHSAEHIAKARLTEGLSGAAAVAAYDPDNPSSAGAAQIALVIGQLVSLKYGRDDELKADAMGVCFMSPAGYDPADLVGVMEVLAASRQGAEPPEFFSTHPNPENRIQRIQEEIRAPDPCAR